MTRLEELRAKYPDEVVELDPFPFRTLSGHYNNGSGAIFHPREQYAQNYEVYLAVAIDPGRETGYTYRAEHVPHNEPVGRPIIRNVEEERARYVESLTRTT